MASIYCLKGISLNNHWNQQVNEIISLLCKNKPEEAIQLFQNAITPYIDELISADTAKEIVTRLYTSNPPLQRAQEICSYATARLANFQCQTPAAIRAPSPKASPVYHSNDKELEKIFQDEQIRKLVDDCFEPATHATVQRIKTPQPPKKEQLKRPPALKFKSPKNMHDSARLLKQVQNINFSYEHDESPPPLTLEDKYPALLSNQFVPIDSQEVYDEETELAKAIAESMALAGSVTR